MDEVVGAPPQIEGYASFTPVGRGGFASVFRAHQLSVNRWVAVKVLDADLFDDDALDSFTREAQALGALSWHPGIVVVYDAGRTADDRAYLAMEFVAGGSLSDATADGPLRWRDVARIGIELCSATNAAHDAGVVHRDIKPANVLVTQDGRFKLADFGIATIDRRTAGSGRPAFTPAYAPPEAATGGEIDERSDIYSIGATLFALLNGRAAFIDPDDRSLPALLERVQQAPVPDLRPGGVPDAFATIIERCMAKRPEDRPADVGEVETALRDLLVEPAATRRGPVLVATAVAAIAVVGAAVLLLGRDDPEPEVVEVAVPTIVEALPGSLAPVSDPDDETAVRDAAAAFVEAFFTFSPATVEDHVAAVLARSTGALRTEVESSLDQAYVDDRRDSGSVSSVDVDRIVLRDLGDGAASVLVEATRTLTVGDDEPSVDSFEIQLDLVLVDAEWRAAEAIVGA